MRTIVRNSFSRQTILAERVKVPLRSLPLHHISDRGITCTECGGQRFNMNADGTTSQPWLYRFHVDDDSGPRHSGPIADGKLFCSRFCAESYIGKRFDETA